MYGFGSCGFLIACTLRLHAHLMICMIIIENNDLTIFCFSLQRRGYIEELQLSTIITVHSCVAHLQVQTQQRMASITAVHWIISSVFMQLVVKCHKILCMSSLRVVYSWWCTWYLSTFYMWNTISVWTLNAHIENFAYSRTEARNKPPKSFSSGHITGSGKLPLSGIKTYYFSVRACSLSINNFLYMHSGANVDIRNTPSIVCWWPVTFGTATLGVLSAFTSNSKAVHS